jgi:hypothetical protein
MLYEVTWTERVYYRSVVDASDSIEAETIVWSGSAHVEVVHEDVIDGSIIIRRASVDSKGSSAHAEAL